MENIKVETKLVEVNSNFACINRYWVLLDCSGSRCSKLCWVQWIHNTPLTSCRQVGNLQWPWTISGPVMCQCCYSWAHWHQRGTLSVHHSTARLYEALSRLPGQALVHWENYRHMMYMRTECEWVKLHRQHLGHITTSRCGFNVRQRRSDAVILTVRYYTVMSY